MNSFKPIVITTALLLTTQVSWAQSSAVLGIQSVPATATAAQKLGKPLPLVPPSSIVSGQARPHVWVVRNMGTMSTAKPQSPPFSSSGTPPYVPLDLQTAYGVNQIVGANGGAGITIAIVDAFHEPYAEFNLNFFSSYFGLPPCTIASGCLTQVGQTGGATPPLLAKDYGWDLEINLDLQWAHSIAPNAKILLIEADDNYDNNLFPAVQYAASHSDIVSNSWGGPEDPSQTYWDITTLENLTVPILASSGDNGAPGIYPCTSPYVTCVGGTSLTLNSNSTWHSETGWSGSGGGCSTVEFSQWWQGSYAGICPTRATPDVAAVADPNTGVIVAMYDPSSGNVHGYQVGGTSLASPVTAAIYANVMAARVHFGKSKFGPMNSTLYKAGGAFAGNGNYPYFYLDITTGNNGYAATPGYDLVTGLGVSRGLDMANRFFGLVSP